MWGAFLVQVGSAVTKAQSLDRCGIALTHFCYGRYPALVALQGKDGKLAIMRSGFEPASIRDFVAGLGQVSCLGKHDSRLRLLVLQSWEQRPAPVILVGLVIGYKDDSPLWVHRAR